MGLMCVNEAQLINLSIRIFVDDGAKHRAKQELGPKGAESELQERELPPES